jgi:hypothetical protein
VIQFVLLLLVAGNETTTNLWFPFQAQWRRPASGA